MRRFANRSEAGRSLAARLASLKADDPVVLGVPRGGVPVAVEVAEALGQPLDVLVVRKLGLPFQPELAMGAVGEDGVTVLNDEVLRHAWVGPEELAEVQRRERAEVDRRCAGFRGGRDRVPLTGRTAVLVDDGIATGSTMRAACRIARAAGARRVVVAVPVASREAVELVRQDADEVVVLEVPRGFASVGQWYLDFAQVPDAEVTRLLHLHDASLVGDLPAIPRQRSTSGEVEVVTGDERLPGTLVVPSAARGVVAFAHGSGSSRFSPRNRYVADQLNDVGLATLLVDLLTPAEEHHHHNVFDIDLLTHRLRGVTRWLAADPRTQDLPLGLFGASTGAAAALATAASAHSPVRAVVSRGGRPDLAMGLLPLVAAPTLLIVGGADDVVLELNRRAQAQLRCLNQLSVVPGATHLFEEPGALPAVARLAGEWFGEHLARLAPATT